MTPPQGSSPSTDTQTLPENTDVPSGAVVVGVDGSPDSDRAVDWAFAEAGRRDRALHLIYAVPLVVDDPAGAEVRESLYMQGRTLLAAATDRRPAEFGGDVTVGLAVGPAAEILLEASAEAGLIVVGSRGHGGFAGLVVGSVSQHVARHAKCPVVIVRDPADAGSDRVVVGVDDSDSAAAAVAFAFEFAAARRASVHAVRAWREASLGGAGIVVPIQHDDLDRARGERGMLNAALEEWTSKYPDISVTAEAVAAHPARVLCDASEHAAHVVVGSRGRGAFAGLLLGSTSQEVLHHSRCTVVVVR
jgi:nucleotide-binding universal stress UspA family protein